MTTYKKRNRSLKGLFILFFLLIILVASVAACNRMKPSAGITLSDYSIDNPIPSYSPHSERAQKYRIVIDPGHGGKDPGATGADGNYERDYTLSLAQQVYGLLEKEPNFEPRLTRDKDVFIELEDRAALANEWEADALVSIHGNTFTDAAVNGTETLYTYNNESIQLAQAIQRQVVKTMGFRDRGIRKDQLVILSLSEMPAVIVEVGYLTNVDEQAIMLSKEGKSKAAQAIVDGIKQFFENKDESMEEEVSPPITDYTIERKIYYNGRKEDGKQVALTFDDGPDSIATPKILDILKENNIKATFFMLGTQAQAHPDVVERIVKEGHAIGNHSWSHPKFDELSPEQSAKQINDTQDLLESISGRRPILFRPPYGLLNKKAEEAIYDMGLAIVNWSVDTMDWSGLKALEILELVHEQIWPGGIVLLHSAGGKDHRANTIDALEQMIPELRDLGYSFVTVPKLLNLPDSQQT